MEIDCYSLENKDICVWYQMLRNNYFTMFYLFFLPENILDILRIKKKVICIDYNS